MGGGGGSQPGYAQCFCKKQDIASKIHKLKCVSHLFVHKQKCKKRRAASYFFGGCGVGLPGNLIVMNNNNWPSSNHSFREKNGYS